MMSFLANQHKTFISLHVHSQLKTLNMSQKISYAFLVTQEIYTNVWQFYIYISSAKHIYAHSDWLHQSMATYSGNPRRETTKIGG
jgi:hypothetical protein